MRYITKKAFSLLALLFVGIIATYAQDNVVDKIIAVVGNQVVLKSDVESTFQERKARGYISGNSDAKSEIFEDLLIQKLMIAQAQVDSVEVTEQEVENELEQKMQHFITQIGSKEKLEQYFGKSIYDMKNFLRDRTREEKISRKMQGEITKNIRITPAEVREYYNKIPKDSLPIVAGELEVQQIVKKPQITSDEKDRIRKRLRGFRERVLNGETFATLAVLYSEGPSARQGGELGYNNRADLVPEFANIAFNLKPGKVSKIVETEFGYHIIQLIDRKGERINVRHILLKPKIKQEKRDLAIAQLDSIADMIRNEKLSFDEAALYFSEDKDTRNNGGLLVNPQTASSFFEKDALDGAIAKEVNKLKVNEISDPFLEEARGITQYKIIKIKSEKKAHKANLSDDWSQFESMLTRQKQEKVLAKWIKEKQASTYVSLDDEYKNAKFRFKGWIK